MGDVIKFNCPPMVDNGLKYIENVIRSGKLGGDGEYTKKCSKWMEEKFKCKKVLLTTSGSMALDMAAILCDIKPDDEVILPSFTFSSTANSFVLRGARLVFVDINPRTMNIDEKLVEQAVTERTKVIIPVHYAGVSCNMDDIMNIASRHNILVVEDAAQGVMSSYKGKCLGTIGDIGCYSFHETKNFSMGEGGAVVINNEKFLDRAEIIREKGTNRSQFFRGLVDKYTWVDIGDSFLPSDLNAAYLWAQLEAADDIINKRIDIWNRYSEAFKIYNEAGKIKLPSVPCECKHNGHLFYIKFKSLDVRTDYIKYMKRNDIMCSFHYIPLHSAPAGLQYGRFFKDDIYTTSESEKLVRLPLYYNLSNNDVERVIECTKRFIENL